MSAGRARRRRAPEAARLPAPVAAAARGRRRPGLATWGALVLGAWAGRLSAALPAGLEDAIDRLLPLAAAAVLALSYRRWVRRRLQQRAGERERS